MTQFAKNAISSNRVTLSTRNSRKEHEFLRLTELALIDYQREVPLSVTRRRSIGLRHATLQKKGKGRQWKEKTLKILMCGHAHFTLD